MKHARIKEAVFPLNEIRAQACSRKIKEAVQRVGGQYSSPIPHAQLLEIQSEPRNEHLLVQFNENAGSRCKHP